MTPKGTGWRLAGVKGGIDGSGAVGVAGRRCRDVSAVARTRIHSNQGGVATGPDFGHRVEVFQVEKHLTKGEGEIYQSPARLTVERRSASVVYDQRPPFILR